MRYDGMWVWDEVVVVVGWGVRRRERGRRKKYAFNRNSNCSICRGFVVQQIHDKSNKWSLSISGPASSIIHYFEDIRQGVLQAHMWGIVISHNVIFD